MRRAVWALTFAVPLVALLAYGFGRNPDTIQSPLIGKPAAHFALQEVSGGRTVSLAALRGRPVVLNFWASWCEDCKVEHPYLEAAWKQYRKAVSFVGVDYQDSPSSATAFMRQWGGGWPIVHDPDQHTAINYGVYGVPETFFIDRRGVIRYKSVGPVSWEDLQSRLQSLVRSKA